MFEGMPGGAGMHHEGGRGRVSVGGRGVHTGWDKEAGAVCSHEYGAK